MHIAQLQFWNEVWTVDNVVLRLTVCRDLDAKIFDIFHY